MYLVVLLDVKLDLLAGQRANPMAYISNALSEFAKSPEEGLLDEHFVLLNSKSKNEWV